MKITCIAVDDVKLNLEVMEDLIKSEGAFELLGTFSEATGAMTALEDLEPDVVFLDLEMPSMSGFEFLNSVANPPLTVVTTSHKEFAAQGFEMNVFDYLVKPISRKRFATCTARLIAHFKGRQRKLPADQLFIKVNQKYVRVKLSEILYVEAQRDFVMVCTEKHKYMILTSLKEFTQLLPEDQFLRIHRSYVVPVSKIEELEGNTIKIAQHAIPISDSYRRSVYRFLLGKEN